MKNQNNQQVDYDGSLTTPSTKFSWSTNYYPFISFS